MSREQLEENFILYVYKFTEKSSLLLETYILKPYSMNVSTLEMYFLWISVLQFCDKHYIFC